MGIVTTRKRANSVTYPRLIDVREMLNDMQYLVKTYGKTPRYDARIVHGVWLRTSPSRISYGV